jgi:hypothetical protein
MTMRLDVWVPLFFRIGDVETTWWVHVRGWCDGLHCWDLEVVTAESEATWSLSADEFEALVRRELAGAFAAAEREMRCEVLRYEEVNPPEWEARA